METVVRQIDPEWENYHSPANAAPAEPLDLALGRIPVFGLLERPELRRLARLVHVRRFAAGETVVRHGVRQSGFYLIRTGSVHVVRERADGRRETVTTLYPPELLGEFALLDDSPRSNAIVAAEPSELIGFFKPDLMDILVTRPAMGCRILLRLAEGMTRTLAGDYGRLREMGFPWEEGQGEDRDLDPTAA